MSGFLGQILQSVMGAGASRAKAPLWLAFYSRC